MAKAKNESNDANSRKCVNISYKNCQRNTVTGFRKYTRAQQTLQNGAVTVFEVNYVIIVEC